MIKDRTGTIRGHIPGVRPDDVPSWWLLVIAGILIGSGVGVLLVM